MCLMRKSHLGHKVNFFFFLNWPFFNDGSIKISRQIILHYWESNGPLLRERRKCARTAWAGSANQITRLNNKEIQNKNKRPQWLLGEGGPLTITACARYLTVTGSKSVVALWITPNRSSTTTRSASYTKDNIDGTRNKTTIARSRVTAFNLQWFITERQQHL